MNFKNNYVNFYLFCLEKNLNNKSVFQKYFLYQLKKNIIIENKYSLTVNTNNLSNYNHKNTDENNASNISYEFFANNFNINYTKIFSCVREKIIDFQTTIIISDYIIYKDKIFAKCENSVFYIAKKITNEELCVL